MSAPGQERTFRRSPSNVSYSPKADVTQRRWRVYLVAKRIWRTLRREKLDGTRALIGPDCQSSFRVQQSHLFVRGADGGHPG